MNPNRCVTVLLVAFLAGCRSPAVDDGSGNNDVQAEKSKQPTVLIERVGEQVVGVTAAHDDVQVVNDMPPATEMEYRQEYGEAPKRFIFSRATFQFYTYSRGGTRIMLKSAEPSPR